MGVKFGLFGIREKGRLRIFEKKLLRIIFKHKRDEVIK
jgi:hypothetical protein